MTSVKFLCPISDPDILIIHIRLCVHCVAVQSMLSVVCQPCKQLSEQHNEILQLWDTKSVMLASFDWLEAAKAQPFYHHETYWKWDNYFCKPIAIPVCFVQRFSSPKNLWKWCEINKMQWVIGIWYKRYSVKMLYKIIQWVCLGIPK